MYVLLVDFKQEFICLVSISFKIFIFFTFAPLRLCVMYIEKCILQHTMTPVSGVFILFVYEFNRIGKAVAQTARRKPEFF
jgi:hypothetical protein